MASQRSSIKPFQPRITNQVLKALTSPQKRLRKKKSISKESRSSSLSGTSSSVKIKKNRTAPRNQILTKIPLRKSESPKRKWDGKTLHQIRNLNLNITSRNSLSSSTANETIASNEITPEFLLDVINNNTDKFLDRVVKTLLELYGNKKQKYTDILNTLPQEDEEEEDDDDEVKRFKPEKIINNMIQLADLAIKSLKKITVKKNLLEAINDPINGILSIAGERRQHIRNHLCRQLFMLSRGYQPFMDLFMNIIFTGPAGVGKSKVAQTVAFVYSKSGILLRPPPRNISILSPKDFIGGFVGQTAIKTSKLLLRGLESVIFIDEAYSLMNCKDGKISAEGDSYGPEAITEIVNYLDKFVGLSVMIVAGYEREMKGCFLAANEGLSRRFPHKYKLPPYTSFDLLKIFVDSVNRRTKKNMFNSHSLDYTYSLIKLMDKNKVFENQAGDILNLVGDFLSQIYGSKYLVWKESGADADNEILLNNTFIEFLKSKNYKAIISRK
jgi:hypothetical protein